MILLVTIAVALLSISFLALDWVFNKQSALLLIVTGLLSAIAYAMKNTEGIHFSLSSLASNYSAITLNHEDYALIIVFFLLLVALGIYTVNNISMANQRNALLCCATASLLVLFPDYNEYTIFFCEILSITTLMLMRESYGKNLVAFMHYACAHFISGGCILAFVAISNHIKYPVSYLAEIALLINCSLFPFAAILVNGYSSVPHHQTLILQAYASKASIFLLAYAFSGSPILMVLGATTCIYAIIFLLLENSIIKFLLYNTVGQLGLLSFAIGEGAEVTPHIISSMFYQSALYMTACYIIDSAGISNFSEISGMRRKMPLALIVGSIACCSMGAFPLTPGFYSKILISESLSNPLVFSVLSYGLWIACGLKFICSIFLGTESANLKIQSVDKTKTFALVMLGILCLLPIFNPIDLLEAVSDHWFKYSMWIAGSVIVFIISRPQMVLLHTTDIDAIYLDALQYLGTLCNQKAIALYSASNERLSRGFKKLRNYCNQCRISLGVVDEIDCAGYFGFLFFILTFLLLFYV